MRRIAANQASALQNEGSANRYAHYRTSRCQEIENKRRSRCALAKPLALTK